MIKKKGFTLIELIAVLAILGLLALFLVPSFIGYAHDAKKAVCDSNLTSIQRAYFFRMTKQESQEDKSLLESVMKNAYNDFSKLLVCPSGGTYYIIDNGSEGASAFQAVCTEHSHALGKIPTQIMNQVAYFTDYVRNLDVGSDEFMKYYELYQASGGTQSKDMFKKYVLNNNSELRKYLKHVNGGTWPTLEVDGTKLFVQPYLDASSSGGRVPSGDTIIYASANDGNNWVTNYIYDSDLGKWWTGNKAIIIANNSAAEVKAQMQTAGWHLIEDPQDLIISGQIIMP